jgi:hypothetical protein
VRAGRRNRVNCESIGNGSDSDGYGSPSVTTRACTQPAGWVTNNTDSTHGATETDVNNCGGCGVVCTTTGQREQHLVFG